MNGTRKLLLAVMFVILAATFSVASDIYVAQNPTGGNTGADCADAHGASWFNSSSNWGSSAGQIGPGTTVYLCGTFTAPAGSSGYLTFQASGTSGNPITLLFEGGAVLTSPYWSGPVINLNGKSNVVVDGGTNGIIQATANGTNLANQQDNGICVNNGTPAGNASNITVQNLTCSNLYVDASPSDNGGEDTYGIDIWNTSNLVLQNNTIHDTKWGTRVSFGGGATYIGVSFTGNTVYNVDHCFFHTDSGTGANVTVNNTLVYANSCHDFSNWDNTANNNHHDGFHLSANAGSTFKGIYIYNNYLYGNIGANANAGIFSFPDANTMWNYYVFNNVFVNGSASNCWANGFISWYNVSTGPEYTYNNTFVSNASSCKDNGLDYSNSSATLYFENNLFQNVSNNSMYINNGTTAGTIDHNNYYLSTEYFWQGANATKLSSWQSDCDCDSNSGASNPQLNANYQQTSGSPLIGAGANLHSVCSGQPNPGLGALCSDRAGTVRPSSGNWDIGAYYDVAPQPPNPPTKLAAIVH